MRASKRVRRYLATTFAITWPSWWTLAALGGLDDGPAPLLLVGGSGPLVAALVTRNAEERRDLLRSSVRADRLGRAWGPVLAVGVGPALAATAAAAVAGRLEGKSLAAALGALAFGLVAGIGEEPGWRGTLLGPWIERHGAIAASLRIGVVWSVWHLPLYFASGTYQADQGLGAFAASLVVLPALSILLTWTFERSGLLVVAPLLAHAFGNAAGEILPAAGTAAEVAQSAAIIAGAIVVAGWLRSPRRTSMAWRSVPETESER